ncbi:putative ribonuclease H-like domain-containing protein, partial [Tanacetum coccineum]
MESIGSSPCLNTRIVRPESNWGNSDCWLTMGDIIEIQKVNHTVKIDKVKQIVDVESSGKSADEIDKETVSFGEMQLKQEDRSCVHASIELYLHVVHVVPNKPKAVKKNNYALLIEDWVSDSEEEDVPQAKKEKKIVKSSFAKIEFVKSKSKPVNIAQPRTTMINDVKGNQVNAVKASACWVWKLKTKGNPQMDLQDQGVIDSRCLRHMTWNMSYLTDFEEIDGGYVSFEGNPKGGKITGRGTIKTGNLDFENVYFVQELQFNLFSVSQMYDKKNSALFNDTECIVLSPNFKLTAESHVLLKVPRKNNMYIVDLKNIVPKAGLTCLFAKATYDESKLWHRRLGHINFKTMNKLVKGNLVRGLPLKLFEIDQTCVSCQKGKQHRASCKSKTVSSINQPLHMLHMDLFGLTFVKSLMKKMYCLVVTDDYSRFSWVFFLATKDETSGILKSFITGVENLIDQRVKVIRCDNGTEFKNKEMNQFCARKAVNTACYAQNKVLVTKSHNKTPYELFLGRKLALGFMRPFGRPITILNTIDHLGKFDGKADEGFFVGYSINSKAFRSMNYKPAVAGNQSNGNAGTKACDDTGKDRMETETDIRQKDEKSSKNDKTGHRMEKHGKAKVKSKPKSTPTKSKPRSPQ